MNDLKKELVARGEEVTKLREENKNLKKGSASDDNMEDKIIIMVK